MLERYGDQVLGHKALYLQDAPHVVPANEVRIEDTDKGSLEGKDMPDNAAEAVVVRIAVCKRREVLDAEGSQVEEAARNNDAVVDDCRTEENGSQAPAFEYDADNDTGEEEEALVTLALEEEAGNPSLFHSAMVRLVFLELGSSVPAPALPNQLLRR